MTRRMAMIAFSVVVASLAGCDGDAACSAGSSTPCSCATGAAGERLCGADGTLGECICASLDAGGRPDSGASDGGDGDAGAAEDASTASDAGAAEDAGTAGDAGTEPDAGTVTSGVAVGAYERRSCAVHPDGRVLCFGRNLGESVSCMIRPVPMAISGITDAVEVAVGYRHDCARRRTGEIVCWGSGSLGELGDGRATSSALPVAVAGIADARQIAIGDRHSCALRADRSVWCWGANDVGQLGQGDFGDPVASPARVPGIADAVQVVASADQSCARLAGGTVRCWGENSLGQLGNGLQDEGTGTPSLVVGLVDAIEVDVGEMHGCAIRASGRVVCWGDGVNGQLGQGSTRSSLVPVDVLDMDDAVDVGAFGFHTCAIRASGEMACWGDGGAGQLGNGDEEDRTRPVAVAAFPGTPESLAGGAHHTCASSSTGDLYCWGGGCGASGSPAFEPLPVRVALP